MIQSFSSSPIDLLAEFDRLQREMQSLYSGAGSSSSIRAVGRGAFPALNVGNTPKSVEIYGFAPGIDPSKLEVNVDRGLLTISGERASDLPEKNDKTSVYAAERFAGPFKRVVSLPEDADPSRIDAQYRDGVLRISVQRRESAQPRRIEIK
jgi:HSP20 family protein